MKKKGIFLAILVLGILGACHNKTAKDMKMLDRDQHIAWCIVPFDAADRSPQERADMLNELGMTRYAYDYRDRHLPEFGEEIEVMQTNGIEMTAVWLWIQDGQDGMLDSTSEFIVSTLESKQFSTQLWVSFPDQYFAGLSDTEKLGKALSTIGNLNTRVERSGISIALYNHGDWFGEPENQVKIIEAVGSENISMVYNFHHAHHHIDRFNDLVPVMLPFLSTLNLNGMNSGGPKILDIGKGTEEMRMLKAVLDAGYQGTFGIIGHTEGEDIKFVLERNLDGLEKLTKTIIQNN